MIGIAANHLLDRRGKALRILTHRGFAILVSHHLDNRQERYLMTRSCALAHHEGRNDRSAGDHSDSRKGVAGRGFEPEEIDENAVSIIQIERNRDHPIVAQQSEHRATRAATRNRSITKALAPRRHRRVNNWIAIGPLHQRDPISE